MKRKATSPDARILLDRDRQAKRRIKRRKIEKQRKR